jgi:hypothetical protein
MDYEGLDNIIEILNSKGVPGHHKKAKEREEKEEEYQ